MAFNFVQLYDLQRGIDEAKANDASYKRYCDVIIGKANGNTVYDHLHFAPFKRIFEDPDAYMLPGAENFEYIDDINHFLLLKLSDIKSLIGPSKGAPIELENGKFLPGNYENNLDALIEHIDKKGKAQVTAIRDKARRQNLSSARSVASTSVMSKLQMRLQAAKLNEPVSQDYGNVAELVGVPVAHPSAKKHAPVNLGALEAAMEQEEQDI